MVAYCDANFAGDRGDSVATYGYCFILNGAAVSWTSRRQDRVARSTADAEYVAVSHTTRDVLWINKLLFESSLPRPITILVDNTTALRYAHLFCL